MRAVVQKVSHSKVTVDGEITGEIGQGLMVLLGVTHEDTEADAKYMAEKIANLRIFEDEDEKISLSDIENRSTDSITKDIDIVLDELKANEIEHVLYYDLTRPELDVNVVRVIIPTMELYSIDPSRAGYRFLRV